MAEKASNDGGSIAVGIYQDGLAKSGDFELWSGTVADLKAAIQKAKK